MIASTSASRHAAPTGFRRPTLFATLLCTVAAGTSSLAASDAPTDAAAAPPPPPAAVRLFAGIDLTVTPHDTRLPILDLRSHQLVVGDAAHSRLRPGNAGSFSALPAIKLSRAGLTITDLQAVRTFTPQNDEVMKGMIGQNELALHAMEQQALREMKHFEGEASRANLHAYAAANSRAIAAGERPPYEGVGTLESMAAEHQAAFGELAAGHDTHAAAMRDPLAADLTSRASGQADFDLLDLSFRLASPFPVHDAYVVVVATVREQGETELRTFYESVGRLDAQPRTVRLRRAGFQPGFELGEVAVHVYTRGQELGTNLSSKATALTLDQAREFLLLTDLGEHATESLPARPVWSLAPAALLGAAAAPDFDRPVAVNIDADGRIISIHDSVTEARAFVAGIAEVGTLRTRDTPVSTGPAASFAASIRTCDTIVAADQTHQVPPHVVAAVQEMVFLPALEAGQPVPSTVEFNLAAFFP